MKKIQTMLFCINLLTMYGGFLLLRTASLEHKQSGNRESPKINDIYALAVRALGRIARQQE